MKYYSCRHANFPVMAGFIPSFLTEFGFINLVLTVVVGVLLGWFFRGRYGRAESQVSERDVAPTTYLASGTGDYKMVLVVRQDLGMGKGKVAAQCAHAAVGLYAQLTQSNPQLLEEWNSSGCAKVVVKTPDETTLKELAQKARSFGLETCLIRDAGRTQIAPGSKTVLGVGPGASELVDHVTGHLKLY